MWIKAKDNTIAVTEPETGERVEFNDNGKAQVSKEVGNNLIEYDSFEVTKNTKKTKSESEVKDLG